ncbi:unnamed protein product [Pylaiella littoralis]
MDALSEYEMEVGIAFVRHLSGTVAVKTARHPEIPPLAHLLYSSTAVHLYSSTGYDTYHGGVPGIDPVRHTCLQDGERMPRGMHPTAVSHFLDVCVHVAASDFAPQQTGLQPPTSNGACLLL